MKKQNFIKQQRLRFSLMLLLQKRYKLKVSTKFIKKHFPSSTIQDKSIEHDLFVMSEVQKLQKKGLEKKFLNSFFLTGFYTWAILLKALKKTSFLTIEKNLRKFNIEQDLLSLKIKDLISFLFKKNCGYLIFSFLKKYQIQQKLFVEFLNLNNFLLLSNFDYANEEKYFKKIKQKFILKHLKILPTWQKVAAQKLLFQDLTLDRVSHGLGLDLLIIALKEITFSDTGETSSDTYIETSEQDFWSYFLSYDFTEFDDYLPAINLNEKKEAHLQQRNKNLKNKKTWKILPRFISEQLLINSNYPNYFFTKQENRIDFFDYYLPNEIFLDYQEFGEMVSDNFFQVDSHDFKLGDLFLDSLQVKDDDFELGFLFGLNEFYALKNLIVYDQKNFGTDLDFITKWSWKDLLTGNFFSLNSSDQSFFKSSKFKNFSKKSFDKKKFFLYNKNFSLTKELLYNFYTKNNNNSLIRKGPLLFNPIPLKLFEISLFHERNDFEILFGLQSPINKTNTYAVNLNYQDVSLPLNLLNNNQVKTMANAYNNKENFLIGDSKAAISLLTNSNFNDFQAVSKVIGINEINLIDNQKVSFFENFFFVNERNSELLDNLNIYNKYTWYNWSISTIEILVGKKDFFSHPFLNQFHQILFTLYNKNILINFLIQSPQNFWENFTFELEQQKIKSSIILNLFLEKIDFFEDLLIRRFTRLNLFELKELQYTYPLFFFEKQLQQSSKQITVNINYRQFWENSVDLYDWYYLQFADGRWQDYIPFLPPTAFGKLSKMILNFWPFTISFDRKITRFPKDFYDRSVYRLDRKYNKKNKIKKNTEMAVKEDLNYREQFFDLYAHKKSQKTNKFSYEEMLQQTRLREIDILQYPEFFNLNVLQNNQKGFGGFFNEEVEYYSGKPEQKFSLNYSLYDFYAIDNYSKFDGYIKTLEQKKETLNVNTYILPEKNLLQRFVPKVSFFSNFLIFLNKKNNLSISQWIQQDSQYFLQTFLNLLFSCDTNDFQQLSKNYLLFEKNVKMVKLQGHNLNINSFFFNINFFFELKKKYVNPKDLLSFISLLQLSLITDKTVVIYKKQQLLFFLNKLYFFCDILQMAEEPLTEFWYTLFNSFEIGEQTTQKYLKKNSLNQVVLPQYKSFNFLLFSFFTAEEKVILNDFCKSNLLTIAQNKKLQLKNLNSLILSLYTDWTQFQPLNLYSSYQKFRFYEKKKLNYFFNNLNVINKKSFFFQIYQTSKYNFLQIDRFCKAQSFYALMLYQFETFQIRLDFFWLKSKWFITGLKFFLLLFFLSLNFYVHFFLFGIGFSCFMLLRFYLNRGMVNNFTAYATSLVEHILYNIQEQQEKTDAITFTIQKYIAEESAKMFLPSRHNFLFFPPAELVKLLSVIEYRLREKILLIVQSKMEKKNLTLFNPLEVKPAYFYDLRKNKIKVPFYKKNLEKQKHFEFGFFEDFLLPVEFSANSLENYSFDEVKTLKQMDLYWGMPISADKANRNPLYYVLQLSEDHRFFRLFKSKLLYKWFFF